MLFFIRSKDAAILELCSKLRMASFEDLLRSLWPPQTKLRMQLRVPDSRSGQCYPSAQLQITCIPCPVRRLACADLHLHLAVRRLANQPLCQQLIVEIIEPHFSTTFRRSSSFLPSSLFATESTSSHLGSRARKALVIHIMPGWIWFLAGMEDFFHRVVCEMKMMLVQFCRLCLIYHYLGN